MFAHYWYTMKPANTHLANVRATVREETACSIRELERERERERDLACVSRQELECPVLEHCVLLNNPIFFVSLNFYENISVFKFLSFLPIFT